VAAASDLSQSNKDLRETNRILKKRLRSMKNDPGSVSNEFAYNKEKLQSFVNQYSNTTDTEIKFAMLEGIEYYTECILENVQVTGELEGVPLNYLQEIVLSLSRYNQKHKAYSISKDLSDKYNFLKAQIELKEQILYTMQQENSLLLGKLATSTAETDEYKVKILQIQDKINKSEIEIQSLKELYNKHTENLKSIIENNSIESILKEKQDFEDIQISQDTVISSLQTQSEILALKLEQFSVENSGLLAKINIYNNSISRLERDLYTKSELLLESESKFEGFRNIAEKNAQKEIENLRVSEK
jgi:hypothetical protein